MYYAEMTPLRLPKSVESDPRGPQLLTDLQQHSRLLWASGKRRVPQVKLTAGLALALKSACTAGHTVRGLESAELALAAEERGLRMADSRSGVQRGVRVSRLLLLASDGAERFYRQVETLLNRHGSRILALFLDADSEKLGTLLYGPGKTAKLVMLEHKSAVSSVLLSISGQWEITGSE
jgi:hypothetical protein